MDRSEIFDKIAEVAADVLGVDGNTANNEGDRGQSYTWAAASYGDWGSRGRWFESSRPDQKFAGQAPSA